MNWKLAMTAMALAPFAADATDITTLPRDSDKEAFVQRVLEVTKLQFDIRVVNDPESASCGYAITIGGQHFIAVNPKCVGMRSEGRKYSAFDVAVLCHEIGHIVRGHTITNNDPKRAQLEADLFAGYAMALLGGSLTQTQAHAITTVEGEKDPARAQRMAAVAKGWRLARSQGALKDQFWNPEGADKGGQGGCPSEMPFGVHWTSCLIGSVATFVVVIFVSRR